MKEFRLAIFASGGGSNAEKIIEYFKDHPRIEVILVLSNNAKAGVLQRAARHSLQSIVVSKDEFNDETGLLATLQKAKVTHVVLAGFLWLIPRFLTTAYPDRIINIHPALLPKYGGKGMYGLRVHQAVKQAGENESGITIHLVNEVYDEGRILFQKSCRITDDMTAEQIASCVLTLEHQYYPRVIERWVTDNS